MHFKFLPLALWIGLFCATSAIALTTENTPKKSMPNNPINQSTENNDIDESSHNKFPRESYYLGFFGGAAFPQKLTQALKNGYSVGWQYGYHDENFRTELAMNFINNDIKNTQDGTYSIFNLMFNAYYDINYSGVLVPFLGVGVGYVHAWENDCLNTPNSYNCSILRTGNKLGAQGIAGFGLNGKHVRLDLRYRFLALRHSQHFGENIGEVVLNFFF